VLNQSHKNIQLIVVDDASTDNSATIINAFVKNHPEIKFIELDCNVGNCKAFNKGLALAHGDYIIDLAADDVLLPERVEIGVKELQGKDEYGVHFSDAEIISDTGEHLGHHSDKFPHNTIPQGDVYKHLIAKYFICPPSMMFTKSVQNYLRGYDESLSYEDFDFWARSSRQFKYCYSDRVLVKRRVLPKSKSQAQYKLGSEQMRSTFVVCNKIFMMNRNAEEMKALKKRVNYELRQSVLTFNIKLAIDYLFLLKKIGNRSI
jgi:glycosyltransferase involved in cell wall biosynthesis